MYDHRREWRALGISDEEIKIGCALGRLMEDEYQANRAVYGDPAYGSWPEHSKKDQPIKDMILAMGRGETEAYEEWISAGVSR